MYTIEVFEYGLAEWGGTHIIQRFASFELAKQTLISQLTELGPNHYGYVLDTDQEAVYMIDYA